MNDKKEAANQRRLRYYFKVYKLCKYVSIDAHYIPLWLVHFPGGYTSEFLVGVCRPVSQNLTQFQTKIFHFPHPFSDLDSKIYTRFQTFVGS